MTEIHNFSDVNMVTIMGRLVRDPVSYTVGSGISVCTFTVAVNRSWRNKQGESQSEVVYVRCVQWGRSGEATQRYGARARKAYIRGHLKQRQFEHAKFQDTTEFRRFLAGIEGQKTVSTEKLTAAFQSCGPAMINVQELVVEELRWQDSRPQSEVLEEGTSSEVGADKIPF